MSFFSTFFNFYVMKWKVHIKHFCCTPKYCYCLQEYHLCNIWIVSWTSCFHRIPFLLERTDKLWLFRLGSFADIFSKKNFMENKWEYLLPMIKVRFQTNIRILENLYLLPWICSQTVTTFLISSMLLLNNVFF